MPCFLPDLFDPVASLCLNGRGLRGFFILNYYPEEFYGGNVSKNFLQFNKVSFHYESSAENIFSDITLHVAEGWTGIIGASGAGKTTLLKLAAGIIQPTEGNIIIQANIEYCEQRTDELPENHYDLFHDYSKESFRLIDQLELKEEWLSRWNTLSHGERKRVQIATALFRKPEILAVDEPTNHLDKGTRTKLIASLKQYKGVGLIVSHDRDLLDTLCFQCLFLNESGAIIFKGGYTEANQQFEEYKRSAVQEYNESKSEVLRLKKEYAKRALLADKSKRDSSKRHISQKDRDAKSKIDAGRVTGRDAIGGKLKKQMEGRLTQKEVEFSKKTLPKTNALGIKFETEISKRNSVLNLDEGVLPLGEEKALSYPQLIISGNDRIGLKGPNGCGKSTLLSFIENQLNLERDEFTYIPQEIDLGETEQLMSQINELSNDRYGELLIIISRLGSDAKRILDTELPSPGETRKLMLGLGILNKPKLIIMDEPTNHMDLPSIICLENALRESNCPYLLVSHDERFLENLCEIFWIIDGDKNSSSKMVLKVQL